MNNKHPRKPLFIVIISSIVFILIIIIAIIYMQWNKAHDNEISITNINSYDSKVSSDTKTKIYKNIFEIAKINSYNIDDETLSVAEATIRENSHTKLYNPYIDTYVNDFIIDIPSLSQNYRISYTTDTDPEIVTACLLPDEYIYPFYLCTAPSENSIPKYLAQVNNILPYQGATSDNQYIYVGKLNYTTLGNAFMRIEINSCGDASIKELGLQTFKEYLSNHYLNPEEYSYKISDLCDGGI